MKKDKLSFEKVWQMFQETDAKFKETDAKFKETDARLDKKFQETDAKIDRISEQIDKQSKAIFEQGKQIGGLNNKFGTFAEGLAIPSIEDVLYKKFHVTHVTTRAKNKKKRIEIDVLGYSNGTTNEAYIVEIKSHLRQEALEQILEIISNFKDAFPEHKDKKVYGIIASVDSNENYVKEIEKAGIYFANITDNLFKIRNSKSFKAKAF